MQRKSVTTRLGSTKALYGCRDTSKRKKKKKREEKNNEFLQPNLKSIIQIELFNKHRN